MLSILNFSNVLFVITTEVSFHLFFLLYVATNVYITNGSLIFFSKFISPTCGKMSAYILHFCEATGVLYNETIAFLNEVTSFLIATLLFSVADSSLNFCEYFHTEWPKKCATVSTSNFRDFCSNCSLYSKQNLCFEFVTMKSNSKHLIAC